MEEKENNKSEKNVEKKSNTSKKTILIVATICLIVAIILFIISIALKKDNSKSIYNNNQQSDKNNSVNKSNDNNNNSTNSKTKIDKENSNFHIDVAKTNLYVDIQEKKYTNYSRKNKVEYGGDIYFIENNGIYVKHGDQKINININNEKAKYLGEGNDCGGGSVFVLTEEGNVYLVNNPGVTDIKEKGTIIYDKKDAKEIVPIRESRVFTTCGELSLYVLVGDELYSINDSGYQGEIKIYGTRNETHPFSLAYDIESNAFVSASKSVSCIDVFNLILYPDGSLSSNVYCGWNMQDNDTLLKKTNGENLLVNFIYSFEDNLYIVDTEGDVYKLNGPVNIQKNGEREAKANISVEKNKDFNTKIQSIDLEYTLHTEREIETAKWISSKSDYGIKLTFVDGTTKSYYTTDGNNISFDQYYFLNR